MGRGVVKVSRNLGGLGNLGKLPMSIFIIDTKQEHIAVNEANRLGIPVVAIVDTNCDPDIIQYVIPGNDDAIRSSNLMCRVIADAVDEGRHLAQKKGARPGTKAEKAAPKVLSPEEQKAKDDKQAEARNAAAAQQAAREARRAESKAQKAAETETETATAEAPADAPADAPAPTPDETPAAEAVVAETTGENTDG